MIQDFDVEKTQAPEPDDSRNYRLTQDAINSGCAVQNRAYSNEQILRELFSFHPPTELTLPKFSAINQAAKNFDEVVLQNCPPSADRSDVIRKIREARMTANAAVTLNGLSL